LPVALSIALHPSKEGLKRDGSESAPAPGRTLPRFVTGTLTGVLTGVALGIVAVVLFTISNPEVRSAVIVGAGLKAPTPTSDGMYAARVITQAMNPTLAYADEAGIAMLLATTAEVEPQPLEVITPVEADLRDNAMLVFVVLGTLTVLSWAMIMWGLSGSSPGISEPGVE
jgi:hypothetical protein